ncbi:uncharacterized protein LOC117340598 [Pecten maximus]|uniref:uncharacterized protein LOC117340598 n=1 Tax=Pecten maximus TaxID=6579 RepID=UPI0014586DCB|nr:uncharacterized protein LOC117340598 [Pecten maximus]
MTAGEVRGHIRRNPDYPEHFYGFMKGIRGSAAYWNASKLDLLALINAKGPMTWFLTLSANDMNWDDLMVVLCQQLNLPHSKEDIAKLTRQRKRQLMVENPVTTARHFCRRVHHIIHSFILSDEQPLGKVTDYFWRIEFQMRGSPHLHSLWWIQDAPDLDTDEGRQQAPAFIDKYISTKIPVDDLLMKRRVDALQKHSHTRSCQKYLNNKQGFCRFGYPQPLSSQTVMKNAIDMKRSPHCYTIKRQPGSENINPYNPDLLRVWNANMDIQLVGSVYGAAKYVCSYICKPESDEVSKCVREAVSKLPSNSSTMKQLSTIGNVFLTHRQLSAQEAAFKMCGLPLRASSKSTLFINARPQYERSKLLKPKARLTNLDDDSEDIFCSNVFHRYKNRPLNDEFNNMTLASFAAWYIPTKERKINCHELLHGLGFIKKRVHECLVRTPKFSFEQDGDKYYFSLLMLYLPWRCEENILQGYSTAQEAFKNLHCLLQCPNSNRYALEIENAIKQIQSLEDRVMQNYIAPAVALNIEALDNDIPQSENTVMDDPDQVTLYEEPLFTDATGHQENEQHLNNVITGNADDVELNHIALTRLSDEEYKEKINNLNSQQFKVFHIICDYFQKVKSFDDGQVTTAPAPIRLFVSGFGGTGKSHLIQLVREAIVRFSLHKATNDSPPVIVLAPTGMAAFNIQGLTIHNALNLPVQHRSSPKYIPLKGERLAEMRHAFRNTTTVIIDEISMVSYQTFLHIHQRLNDIKCVPDHCSFGNMNVITLGDFYQLPPVSPGKFVFMGESEYIHKWRDLFTMVELTENMRQKEDKLYADILFRIRTATHSAEDVEKLCSRVTTVNSEIDCQREPFVNALHLYPTLKKCETHNEKRLNTFSNKTTIYRISAQHAIHHSNQNSLKRSLSIPGNLIPEDDRECAGLSKEIRLCVGATVMLCRNINTSDGMVNGARGVVTGFVWKNGELPKNADDGFMPQEVMVKFFDQKVGKISKVATGRESISIQPITAEFYAKGTLNTILLRTQFPLCLSWAATIHKVQGVTLKHAVVDIGSEVFSSGMAYVALSRVKSLSGLALLFLDDDKIVCDKNVDDEMKRLRIASLSSNKEKSEE